MQRIAILFRYLLAAVGTAALLLTLLSVGPELVWWIQVLNFPRLQLLLIHAVVLVGLLAVGGQRHRGARLLLVLGTGVGLALQASFILPYTVLGKKTVPDARPAVADSRAFRLRLLVINVLMHNRQTAPLRQLVQTTRPDVLLALETDARWARELRELRPLYPYQLELPRDNTYGMVLYSRLPLEGTRVKYLEHPGVPSIHTSLRLPDGRLIAFHGVHPPPPVPLEYLKDKTHYKEVALLKVGDMVRQTQRPAIVAGDFNDVSWSFTTRMFEAGGKLRNVRLGRGLYNSFRATSLIMRWPLDHIFVTRHFQVAELKRLPGIGSDHFPIYAELVLNEPAAP
ncbi:Endonuclease/exonuclease/phosphatase [Hymenobacter roseosalivarius DSM 11622]|uniref:Endonuclease/exonuclease/phosphatase n=1 Tax=Hymenobacter roseosalivarius DSM 11622 TaxID=645990 RepID=A0A1W1W4P6_9BACT|nr:endonuclease/exonuclease/phosphatase family protein [Hymenobacter roseosalivarius]SMC00361.1 Endonuclease/exonuclease/phosphatase [Hymenobacter roseosalivarius DSM 11622]